MNKGTYCSHYNIQINLFLCFFQFDWQPRQKLDKTLLCTYAGCDARFSSTRGLTIHEKKHQGIYQYRCPYCDKGLYCTNDVKTHLKSSHTAKFGFHCLHCPQEFTSVHLLKQHLHSKQCQGGSS